MKNNYNPLIFIGILIFVTFFSLNWVYAKNITYDYAIPAPNSTPDKEIEQWDLLDYVNNFFSGGISVGGIVILIAYILHTRFKKKALVGVDVLQDVVENRITQKWGPLAGKCGRRLMEKMESTLMENLELYFEEQKKKEEGLYKKIDEIVKQIVLGESK